MSYRGALVESAKQFARNRDAARTIEDFRYWQDRHDSVVEDICCLDTSESGFWVLMREVFGCNATS